ncbi:hypothetical protein ACJX0J_008714, partial [Zea mays]
GIEDSKGVDAYTGIVPEPTAFTLVCKQFLYAILCFTTSLFMWNFFIGLSPAIMLYIKLNMLLGISFAPQGARKIGSIHNESDVAALTNFPVVETGNGHTTLGLVILMNLAVHYQVPPILHAEMDYSDDDVNTVSRIPTTNKPHDD